MENVEIRIQNMMEELRLPSVEDFRENESTIHWILVAIKEFGKDLNNEGLTVDDLDKPSKELFGRLRSTIHIVIYQYTGFDTYNFSELGQNYGKKSDYFKSILVNDIIHTVFRSHISIYEANFIFSNLDKLNLHNTRHKINSLL
ncbi:hypothetical protein [Bacillus sp. SG-1]|uniref:hypothetical protein n=1 Tax=Bacillus sp. SG-1 TaxID=161544 RepID=UPI0001543FDD|nr:hypothetical protein [Bacillus sp. SG-1]EDL65012.1 hypothetical protein BSG1_14864 [Bacillus sp. SG-1]